MKTFQKKGMNQKSSISPTTFPGLAQPSRPFAPVPTSASEQDPRVSEAQLGHVAPVGYSITTLPLFSPTATSSEQSAPVQRSLASERGNTGAIPLSGVFPTSVKDSSVERISQEEKPLERASAPIQNRENKTGLPDALKAGIENLSGISMDDVNVRYNSAKPAQMLALAYTQGRDIHIGPRQEMYLPHEAWHVVQQMQGRVKPTLQAKGVAINDDEGLEREADVMGEKVKSISGGNEAPDLVQRKQVSHSIANSAYPLQRTIGKSGKVNDRVINKVNSSKGTIISVTEEKGQEQSQEGNEEELKNREQEQLQEPEESFPFGMMSFESEPETNLMYTIKFDNESEVKVRDNNDDYDLEKIWIYQRKKIIMNGLENNIELLSKEIVSFDENVNTDIKLKQLIYKYYLRMKNIYDLLKLNSMEFSLDKLESEYSYFMKKVNFIHNSIKEAEKLGEVGEKKRQQNEVTEEGISAIDVPENLKSVPDVSNKDVVEALNSANFKERHKAIGRIRGTDDEEHQQTIEGGATIIKGAIYLPFIFDSREAINRLVELVGDSAAIFSLERGGALLADHIVKALKQNQILNIKVKKPNMPPPEEPEASDPTTGWFLKEGDLQALFQEPGSEQTYTRERHHHALMLSIMDFEEGKLFQLLNQKSEEILALPRWKEQILKDPLITVSVAETVVSGSSANTLLKTLNTVAQLAPYTRFRLLLERQTIKEQRLKEGSPGKMRITDPGINYSDIVDASNMRRIEMFISHTQYMLGEDVDYQLSYDERVKGKPIVIFNKKDNTLVACLIKPQPTTLPRDVLIQLVVGVYDEALIRLLTSFNQ